MRNKKAKQIRKTLKLKLPIQADYRIGKKTPKVVYFNDPNNVETKGNIAVKTERITIINASKYQYRVLKKIMQGNKQ